MRRTPDCSVSPVRNTAASSCMVRCMRSRSFAVGVPPLALRSRSKRARILSSCAVLTPGSAACAIDHLAGAQRRGAAEHHEVGQRVRAQPVGAVHRGAGGFAHRHQAGHDARRARRGAGRAPRRDSSSGCRPYCSAPSAAPGSARASGRRRRKSWPIPKCPAAARAAPWDRDDRGEGRCGPSSDPTPRPSRISIVMQRLDHVA